MNNFGSISNLLMLFSFVFGGLLYFVGLFIPEHHNSIKLGYNTCFILLVLGFTLRHKKVQQLLGLFFVIILYNFDLVKADIFKISEQNPVYHLATYYSFYTTVIALALLIPTLFDNYKLLPLTNTTKIKDSAIIVVTLSIIIIFQGVTRLFLN